MASPLTDSIHFHLQPPTINGSPFHPHFRRNILIYFIPGNPGLIEYYRLFLTNLHAALKPLALSHHASFTITGTSLAGFHTEGDRSRASDGETGLPLNLRQQIEDVERQVLAASTTAAAQGSLWDRDDDYSVDQATVPTEVILIGHSVGAYILMSLLSRRLELPHITNRVKIIAGIGLFPTVVDLHASPNGRKASWISPLPGLSHFLQGFAKLLCAAVSFATLMRLVQRVTGQPEAAARVTAAFLASPMGVRQAVYLAQHELLEMREDRWSDEVWGTTAATVDRKPTPTLSTARGGNGFLGDGGKGSAAPSSNPVDPSPTTTSSPTNPSLFFYFGTNDHWIANTTRDALIATRTAIPPQHTLNSPPVPPRPGPKMILDAHNLPHDFCVREKDSVLVAYAVAGYVREALAGATLPEAGRERVAFDAVEDAEDRERLEGRRARPGWKGD